MHMSRLSIFFWVLAATCVLALPSLAGFEYVPPTGAPVAAQDNVLSPAPAAPAAPVEAVRMLPLPGPVSQEPPAASAVMPVVVLPEEAPSKPHQPGVLRAPAGSVPMPSAANASETKMKTLTLAPEQETPAAAQSAPSIRWNPEEAARAGARTQVSKKAADVVIEEIEHGNVEETALPLPSRAEKPVERKPLVVPPTARTNDSTTPGVETKVVMPDDAPESAAQAIPQTLIKAYPMRKDTGVENAAPASEPVTSQIIEEALPVEAGVKAGHIIEGFGEDMPMAIALQQLAPPGFSFSFGDGVNPGTRVSWEGKGEPWDAVVKTMLAPLGLESVVRGQTIMIRNPHHSAVMPKADAVTIASTATSRETTEPKTLRRQNLTDPGETQKPQPLSQPVASAINAEETTNGAIIEIIEPASGSETEMEAPVQAPATNPPASEAAKAPAAEPVESFLDKALAAVGVKEDGAQTAATIPQAGAKPSAAQPLETRLAVTQEPVKEKAEQALAALDEATRTPALPTALNQSQATQNQPAIQNPKDSRDAKPAIGAKQFFVTPGQWNAQNGQSLKEVLERWSKDAGVMISWEASHDFTLSGTISAEDTFQGAVQTLMDKGLSDNARPSVTFQIPAERGAPGVLLVRDASRG